MTLDYETDRRQAWIRSLGRKDHHRAAILTALIFAALIVVGASDYTDAIRIKAVACAHQK